MFSLTEWSTNWLFPWKIKSAARSKKRNRRWWLKKKDRRLSVKRYVHVLKTRLVHGVKVAPTRYVPVVEEESWEVSPHATSGVVTRNTTLPGFPPLNDSSATDDETMVMKGSNENLDIGSSRRGSVGWSNRYKGSQSKKRATNIWWAFQGSYGVQNRVWAL